MHGDRIGGWGDTEGTVDMAVIIDTLNDYTTEDAEATGAEVE